MTISARRKFRQPARKTTNVYLVSKPNSSNFKLQKRGEFDTKTSSGVKTPADTRKLGDALFGERRYGHVFVGHNGAQSYYSARGFRGVLIV